MIRLIEDNREAIDRLCCKYQVAKLEVFGSAADDTFDPGRSDIDFLVEFHPGADLGPWLSEYFDPRTDLERVLGHSVDLVMPSAMKNPYFIREVKRTRKPVYAA